MPSGAIERASPSPAEIAERAERERRKWGAMKLLTRDTRVKKKSKARPPAIVLYFQTAEQRDAIKKRAEAAGYSPNAYILAALSGTLANGSNENQTIDD